MGTAESYFSNNVGKVDEKALKMHKFIQKNK